MTCHLFSSPDLPSVDLLPPKVISDLRDVAAYYYDTPGENHSGNSNPPLFHIISVYFNETLAPAFFRYNEHVLPDSLQPAGQGTQLPKRGHSESVSACSKCMKLFTITVDV